MGGFGERLKSARKMAGLSMDDLVIKIDGIVTKQSISKYEKGIMQPESSKIVIKLAQALNTPVDYFYQKNSISLSAIRFRKKAILGKKIIMAIQENVKDHLERYFEIEELLNINNIFDNPLAEKSFDLNPISIENAASTLRCAWGIGETACIMNVIALFEKNNIKVIEINAPEGFEGLSGYANENKPIIILNKAANPIRKRFTALHELAHLLLEYPDHNQKHLEKMCHAFAGAFLIARKSIEELLGKRNKISMQELISIKKQYGISIQAIMAREYFLGFISEYHYMQFNIYINKNNLKKNEPGDYAIEEKSDRFERLINRALAEGVISISKASALTRKSISEIEKEFSIID